LLDLVEGLLTYQRWVDRLVGVDPGVFGIPFQGGVVAECDVFDVDKRFLFALLFQTWWPV
jgi:hypothetical protein